MEVGSWFPTTEELPARGTYVEGATKTVTVNVYERHAQARRDCLAHYGHRCSVCDMDFEARYGSEAAGIMHVHHLVPLADVKAEYEVDPIRDLRPVCPNCHAVIHWKETRTVEQVREMLRG